MTTITETVPALVNVPTISNPTNFDPYADDLLGTQFPAMITSFNTATGQVNTVAGEVNANAVAAAASAATATSAANFMGTWTNETTQLGQSWLYGGVIYLVLIPGNTSPVASPSNWQRIQAVGSAPKIINSSTYTVLESDKYLINSYSSTTPAWTLPAVATNIGRELCIKTIVNKDVASDASNVKPLASNTAGTAILTGTAAGHWAKLVCDGSYWVVMSSGS